MCVCVCVRVCVCVQASLVGEPVATRPSHLKVYCSNNIFGVVRVRFTFPLTRSYSTHKAGLGSSR